MIRFSVPGWAIFVGSTTVASIIAVGAVGLLWMGRPVPTEYWVLLTAIGTAYFGSGPFSVALQHLAVLGQQAGATNTALVDTVNHAIAAHSASTTMGGSSANPTNHIGEGIASS